MNDSEAMVDYALKMRNFQEWIRLKHFLGGCFLLETASSLTVDATGVRCCFVHVLARHTWCLGFGWSSVGERSSP